MKGQGSHISILRLGGLIFCKGGRVLLSLAGCVGVRGSAGIEKSFWGNGCLPVPTLLDRELC